MSNPTELVQRLREHYDERLYQEADVLMSAAANEIERLQVCAATLQKIATVNAMDYEYQNWARQALSTLSPLCGAQHAESGKEPQYAELNEHLRQYQHNDGSGLVFGYDKKGIDGMMARVLNITAKLKLEPVILSELTRYSMWSNSTAQGMDSSPTGQWVAYEELQDLVDDHSQDTRCLTCDGTGMVHRADGEYMGECTCEAAQLDGGQEGSGSNG